MVSCVCVSVSIQQWWMRFFLKDNYFVSHSFFFASSSSLLLVFYVSVSHKSFHLNFFLLPLLFLFVESRNSVLYLKAVSKSFNTSIYLTSTTFFYRFAYSNSEMLILMHNMICRVCAKLVSRMGKNLKFWWRQIWKRQSKWLVV